MINLSSVELQQISNLINRFYSPNLAKLFICPDNFFAKGYDFEGNLFYYYRKDGSIHFEWLDQFSKRFVVKGE